MPSEYGTSEFTWEPAFNNGPVPSELVRLGYGPHELEAIDHIRQLANSLVEGEIGFQHFQYFCRVELKKVGW